MWAEMRDLNCWAGLRSEVGDERQTQKRSEDYGLGAGRLQRVRADGRWGLGAARKAGSERT